MISHFLQIPGGVLFFYPGTQKENFTSYIGQIVKYLNSVMFLSTHFMEKIIFMQVFLFWREIIQLSLTYIKWRKLKEKQMSCPEYIILLFGKK